MDKKDMLLATSEDNDGIHVGCPACIKGICEDTGDQCDACYENNERIM